jgi:hypothetical protein
MIRHFLFGLAAIAWLSFFPVDILQAQFEGIVKSKNSTIDETGRRQEYVMTMLIKTDMVRIQTISSGTMPSSTIIYRSDKHTVWVLNDNDKTYFEIPQSQETERHQSGGGGVDSKYSVRKSGKTKQILGYLCDQLLISGSTEKTEIWGTKKLGALFSAISKALGDEKSEPGTGWTDEIMKMGYFPLVSATKIENQLVESQEVTTLQHKKLSTETFDLPAGYRKQAIGEMLEEWKDSTRH